VRYIEFKESMEKKKLVFVPNEFTLGPMAQAMLVRHDRITTHNKIYLEPNREG
jgi:hypothetical protein